jgi:hypothetical protein
VLLGCADSAAGVVSLLQPVDQRPCVSVWVVCTTTNNIGCWLMPAQLALWLGHTARCTQVHPLEDSKQHVLGPSSNGHWLGRTSGRLCSGLALRGPGTGRIPCSVQARHCCRVWTARSQRSLSRRARGVAGLAEATTHAAGACRPCTAVKTVRRCTGSSTRRSAKWLESS